MSIYLQTDRQLLIRALRADGEFALPFEHFVNVDTAIGADFRCAPGTVFIPNPLAFVRGLSLPGARAYLADWIEDTKTHALFLYPTLAMGGLEKVVEGFGFTFVNANPLPDDGIHFEWESRASRIGMNGGLVLHSDGEWGAHS